MIFHTDIRAAVCDAFGVKDADLNAPRRSPPRLVLARFALYLLMRDLLGASSTRIGQRTGRDHTTAIHGCRRAAELMQTDPDFAAKVNAIKARLTQAEAA